MMAVYRLLLPLALTAAGGLPLSAAPLHFRPGIPLADGAADLLPGTPGAGYAIPCVTDWNGDGRKDLLVGYQSAGKIALYLNQGSDTHPCFTNFTNLKTGGGREILHPSNGCGAPAPWVCDFDGDGRRDLLVGGGMDGTIWLYRNTNTDTAPLLDAGVKILIGSSPLTVGIRAAPYFYDWDKDGLPDLLSGSGDGYVYLFKNTNSVQVPIFGPGVKIVAGAELMPGIRSVVRMHDLDNDGRDDLVCSSDTGVYWCRNTNSNKQIILAPPLALEAPVPSGALAPILAGTVPGARMRLDIVDWDGDGVPDLLVGNHAGNVVSYQGYVFRVLSLQLDHGDTVLQWASAPFLNYRILQGANPTDLQSLSPANCPSMGNVTRWTNSNSQGQQFYRVQIAP